MTRGQSGRELARDLPSLTSLRAAAALLVFAYHLTRWDVLPVPLAKFGFVGVSFFFVLSGFILTWGYRQGTTPRRFYARRFARIYPSHLVTWALIFALPVTDFPLTRQGALSSLFLIQSWVPGNTWAFAMNGVSWSLACEAFFYALFPFILAAAGRLQLRTLVAVTVALYAVVGGFVVACSLPPLAAGHWSLLAYVNPAVRLPEFLLGIMAARAVQGGWRPRWPLAVGVLFGCLVGAAVIHAQPALDVWTAPVCLLLVVAAARWDCAGPNWAGARPLVYAGKVSFAFYLVHEATLINVRHVLGHGGPATAVVALVVAAAAAVALHHLVELPAQRWIVSLLRARRRTTASDPVAA